MKATVLVSAALVASCGVASAPPKAEVEALWIGISKSAARCDVATHHFEAQVDANIASKDMVAAGALAATSSLICANAGSNVASLAPPPSSAGALRDRFSNVIADCAVVLQQRGEIYRRTADTFRTNEGDIDALRSLVDGMNEGQENCVRNFLKLAQKSGVDATDLKNMAQSNRLADG